MGQGSQSGIDGRHPAWSQMAQVGGGQQLPDPMQLAREQFLAAREQFQSNPQDPQALGTFQQMRDWYSDLQAMPDGQARGTAAMGPPRMNEGPQFAPTMAVPQFPGMEQHDGTVQGLLGILQQQTAKQGRRFRAGGGDDNSLGFRGPPPDDIQLRFGDSLGLDGPGGAPFGI